MIHYLIIPGYQGSGDDHWQTHWQQLLAKRPNATVSRLEVDDWFAPAPRHWISRLDNAIRQASAPIVVIAHSLGCVTLNHWVQRASAADRQRIIGALLVAPSDPERALAPAPLRPFAPVNAAPLPFASTVISADNDYAATVSRAHDFARQWGAHHVVIPNAGHINRAAGFRHWHTGLGYLAELEKRATLLLSAQVPHGDQAWAMAS